MLATKWTKFKYSGFTKALTSLLVLAGGTVFIWCFLWYMLYGNLTKSELADNYEYSNEFMMRVDMVAELTTSLKSIENINRLTLEEDEDRTDLYERYNQVNRTLDESVNFVYIIRDLKTNRLVNTNTDLSINDLMAQKNHVMFSESQVLLQYGSIDHEYELAGYQGYINNSDSRYWGEEILSYLSQDRYELYAAIVNDLQEGDIFYNLSVRNDSAFIFVAWWQRLLFISSVFFAVGLILVACQCGRNPHDESIKVNGFDRIFTEIQIAAFFGIAALVFFAVDNIRYNSELANRVSVVSMQLAMASFLATLVGWVCYCSLIRQIKGRILLKSSIIGACFRGVRNIFWRLEGLKMLRPSWLLFFLLYGVGSAFSGALVNDGGILFFILIQVVFGFVFLKQLAALKQIMETTKRVSVGELDVVLDTRKFPKVMVDFYDNIYHVQSDMRLAIQNAVKGERMKAELITNVSHDLKTPLTSIISYVDLLSKEPLETENAKTYVEVLVKKTDMLKRLIDDLIDVSKVSSGNVKMTCTEIGLNELVRQSIGEFEEKFGDKSLDIRVQEENDVSILADGKAMWRVIENIFDNLTKYARADSRVYIDLFKRQDQGVLVVKNISEEALDISPEELMQRFVRGAESRSTEGSGLGLSIAEGLIKAQKGSFNIEIDGDLFKVTIELPLKE